MQADSEQADEGRWMRVDVVLRRVEVVKVDQMPADVFVGMWRAREGHTVQNGELLYPAVQDDLTRGASKIRRSTCI